MSTSSLIFRRNTQCVAACCSEYVAVWGRRLRHCWSLQWVCSLLIFAVSVFYVTVAVCCSECVVARGRCLRHHWHLRLFSMSLMCAALFKNIKEYEKLYSHWQTRGCPRMVRS